MTPGPPPASDETPTVRGTVDLESTRAEPFVPVVAPEQPGAAFGPYRLVERLGEGGFGSVWLAEQQEPVRRRVAFKILKLGMDTRQVVARFEAERQTLARMQHPNIATVFDAGATATGRPFFVMELVEGQSLTTFCDQHRLGLQARLELFVTLCHALQHAHQKGIIHRDIKPSNILVRLHEGSPLPKIIDFGIAKATTAEAGDPVGLTLEHQLIGTPAYMSPEQMTPGASDIDTRSDLYALGVVLYELLTGITPFDSRTLWKAGFETWRLTLTELDPPAPSTRFAALDPGERDRLAELRGTDPSRLVRALRGDLDGIVLKCLERDRSRRYETAGELAADVLRHLHDEPVSARPPSRSDRLVKLVRRHRFAFALVSGIFAALCLGLGIATWMFLKEREARRAARAAATTSAEVAAFLESMLEGVGPSVAMGRDTQLLREILDRTAERVGRGLRNQPQVEVTLRRTIGRTYTALGAITNAAAVQEAALDLARRLDAPPRTNLIAILTDLGLTRQQQGRIQEAETLQREALEAARRAFGGDHPALAEPLRRLGALYSSQGRLAEAEPLLVEAVRLLQQDRGDEDARSFQAIRSLAILRYRQERFGDLEEIVRGPIVSATRLLGPDHPWVTDLHSLLALGYQSLGRFSEAEQIHRAVLDSQRRVSGAEHPDTLATLNNLALVLNALGRCGEAHQLLGDVHAIHARLLGPEDPDTLGALSNLAESLSDCGHPDEAEHLFRQIIEVHGRTLPEAHPYRLETLHSLVVLLRRLGRWSEADSLAREVLRVRCEALPVGHPKIADSLLELAGVLLDCGQPGEAEALVREAWEIRRARLPDHWLSFLAEAQLGRALLDLSRPSEARPLLLAGYGGLRERLDRLPAAERSLAARAAGQLARLARLEGRAEDEEFWAGEARQGAEPGVWNIDRAQQVFPHEEK